MGGRGAASPYVIPRDVCSVGVTPRLSESIPWRQFVPSPASYFAYGLGFVGYIAFVVAWAEQKTESALEVSAVWSVLSLVTMIAPLLWGGLLARWSGARVLALAM